MNKTYTLSVKYGVILALIFCIYRIALYYISIPLFVSIPLILFEVFLVYPLVIFVVAKKIRNQSTEGWSYVEALKNIALLMLVFNIVSFCLPAIMGSLDTFSTTRPHFEAEINNWYEMFNLPDEQRLAEIAKLDVKRSIAEKIGKHFTDFMIGKVIMLLLFTIILKNKKPVIK